MWQLILVLLLAGDPKVEGLLRQGLVELQQNRLPSARQTLEAADKLDSGNPFIWGALAQT